MIKQVMRGLAVVAVLATVISTTFTSRASAAFVIIDSCTLTTLKWGSIDTTRPSCVMTLQKILNEAKFMYGQAYNNKWPPLTQDGIFKGQTEAAVIAYQFSVYTDPTPAGGDWIYPDGIVGRKTWKALKADCSSWFNPECVPIYE